MDSPANKMETKPLSLAKGFLYLLAAVASFTLAYSFNALSFLIVVYLYCLISLARVETGRQAFYFGLAVGMLAYPIQLICFYTIFGPAAIALWFVLAFWLGLFVMLSRLCLVNFKLPWAAMLIPFLWTGLEYFRSELYCLRFSWLNVGYAFSSWPIVRFETYGMYFIGFLLVFYRALFLAFDKLTAIVLFIVSLIFVVGFWLPSLATSRSKPSTTIRVAGIQLEFQDTETIMTALDTLVEKNPNAELLVLSEYTLGGLPPQEMKNWCRDHQKFLIVGGKEDAPNNDFYNTAFVISTNGEVVFKQAKSVPIQFFKDGLPAPEQKLWESPWGKIGICICYDLSYTRVTDELVRQGAQMLIVPTMDVADWGRRQHELHARVAPVRAAEYGIPIFRLASSGISQGVNEFGWVRATAPFPGDGEMIFFGANLDRKGSLPLDRILAPFCVFVSVLVIIVLTAQSLRRKSPKKISC